MKKTKRILAFVLCLALCLGTLPMLTGSRADAAGKGADMLRKFYQIFGKVRMTQSQQWADVLDQPKAIVKLGELEFEGNVYAPSLSYLTDEEIAAIIDQTMKDLGTNIDELYEAYKRGYTLEFLVATEGFKKLGAMLAQFLPFGGTGVTVVRSIDKHKMDSTWQDAAIGVGLDALGFGAGKINPKKFSEGLKRNAAEKAKNAAPALSLYGFYTEAKDTRQYEEFIKKNDKLFTIAAKFYALCNQRMEQALEEKNKNNTDGWIIIFQGEKSTRELEGKSLWGVSGQTVKYELFGVLRKELGPLDQSDLEVRMDRSGTYEGELTLRVSGVNMAETFDARFREACTLNVTDDGHATDWDQILQKFSSNTPFYLDDVTEAYSDVTDVPTQITRILRGNFTATLGEGLGAVALSGAFNNVSDTLEVQFQHTLYYLFYYHYYEELPDHNVKDWGQVEERVTISAVPGTIAQLHVLDKGNDAAQKMVTALWWQFQSPGRRMAITKEGQGTFFDQLEFAPTMELQKAD